MLNEFLKRYPILKNCEKNIVNANDIIVECYENGNKVMLCGNGGSCADCEHIAGELMKGFLSTRPISEAKKIEMKAAFPAIENDMLNKLQNGLPAIPLTSFTGLNSAFCNDVDAEFVYAQSLFALGKKGDVLIGLSTSGNSKNVVNAFSLARAMCIKTIALTGQNGGKLKDIANVCICVPETETFKVQELHLPVYHYLCAQTETHFFK